MKQKWVLVSWLGFLVLHSNCSLAGISQEQIFARYKNLQGLHAEIKQSKQSPLLLRPIITLVTLNYRNGLLSWEPKGQAAIQLRFVAGKEPEWVKGPAIPGINDPVIKKRMIATLEAVRDLLLISPRLSERFDLDLKANLLSLSPKAGMDSGFLQKIELNFAADLSLLSMRLISSDDETTLNFERLDLERELPVGAKPP